LELKYELPKLEQEIAEFRSTLFHRLDAPEHIICAIRQVGQKPESGFFINHLLDKLKAVTDLDETEIVKDSQGDYVVKESDMDLNS
jgi:hypothetical protein